MANNKDKARLGLFVGIFSILIFIFLITFFLIFGYNVSNGFGNAVVEVAKVTHEVSKNRDLSKKQIINCCDYVIFTGITTENDSTFTNALKLKFSKDDSIYYDIESLINWKSKPNKKGVVFLDSLSVLEDKYKIEDRKKRLVPAFRFTENNGNNYVEILIKKGNYEQSEAVVNEIDNGKIRQITNLLRYK